MKILITKIAFLICAVLITILVLVLLAPKDELAYYAAMDDKVRRLKQLPSPKIILVGGSNLTFGVDSKRIENNIKLPVVNMSLHAGLGLESMLHQIINLATKGDIILISAEYIHFKNNYKGDGNTIYRYILNNIRYVYDYSPSILLYHIDAFGPMLFNQLKQSFIKTNYGIYTKVNINEYGDMTGHIKLEHVPFSEDINNNSTICDIEYSQIDNINNFVNNMNDIGANTYISFQAISETSYNNDKTCNDKIAETIKTRFKSIVISDNGRYIFNDNLFFNTSDHLDNIGRNFRTDYLIRDLSRVISSSQSQR